MASELDSLKEIIMNVINGGNPAAMLIKAAQDAVKSAIAEAKYMAEMTAIVVPQQAALAAEIAALEGQKAAKMAEKLPKEAELMVNNNILQSEQTALKAAQEFEAIQKKARDKAVARAKARGEEVPESKDNEESTARKLKKTVDEQQKTCDAISKEIEVFDNEIADIENQIAEKQKTIKLLTAQLSPAASLAESKQNKIQAQQKVDNAPTPEARAEAEKELEEAEQEETAMQAISDDHDTAVENKETENEPKMMQLQAEYQIMDAGVKTIQNLTTNLVTLLGPSGLSAVPTTIVAGSATGAANPAYSFSFGNVLYPYGYFIMATVKAASVRFMALAQELEYTPTSEMAIINQIAPTEQAFKAALTAFAPAGASLM